MADTTVTIAASGADYTTIASALAASDVSSGAWIMQITDTRNYGALTADDTLTFAATTGTPTQANRLILEADANSRHSGVLEADTSSNHAKLMSTNGSANAYQFDDSYTEIRYMHFGSATGHDVARFNTPGGTPATDVLFSRCILYIEGATTADHVFQYVATSGTNTFSLYLDNCVVVDAGAFFTYSGALNNTVNLYVDHCLVETASSSAMAIECNFATSDNQDFNVYVNNSWFEATGGSTGYVEAINSKTNCSATVSGAYNVGDQSTFGGTGFTDNTTNYEYASGGLTEDAGESDAIIVTSFSILAKEVANMTPVVATGIGSNQILGYAGNRIGSEPDSRQDFSTDIVGNVRTGRSGFIDVGPFQITEAPPGFKYYNGTTWADSVSVKYYNGTAWADVVAVKYWNGSTWADPV